MKGLPATARSDLASLPVAALPEGFHAELATLVDEAPRGELWLHEVKFDGYRIGCRIDRGKVRLISRNGKDWTGHFPEIAAAARRIPVDRALLDGEVTVLLEDGRTSFQALQNAFGRDSNGGVVYFVFDLLHCNGRDVARAPLEARKRLLRKIIGRGKAPEIRYSDHFAGDGNAFLREACGKGLEGIVSKRRDLPYRPGRSPGWLKTKCVQRQEFVIGGFTDPEGSREGIGALLVGVQQDGKLVFAGKVGTGFTQKSSRALRRDLEQLEEKTCPFVPPPPGRLGKDAHWVRPKLVAEVRFTEWTEDGKLRHPSFQGLRADKSPADVKRELPKAVESNATRSHSPSKNDVDAAVVGIRISHPSRVMYPEPGLTKLDVARYYESIADWIVPHVRGRPLTLYRCPKGVGDGGFFMKHSKVWAPDALRRVRIQEKKKVGEYLIADTLAAVVALVQMDVLEIHTWNSQIERVEKPNRIVLDLDPGPRVEWREVVEAARTVRRVFDTLRLESFVKTTGEAGLHVVVPLAPERDWTECFRFSRAIAEAITRADPSRYTTAIPKAGRERKILIDYLRNNRTNTSVAEYSTRARPNASVAVPLAWDELSVSVPSSHYTLRSVPQRVRRLRKDPWEKYLKLAQRFEPSLINALDEVR